MLQMLKLKRRNKEIYKFWRMVVWEAQATTMTIMRTRSDLGKQKSTAKSGILQTSCSRTSTGIKCASNPQKQLETFAHKFKKTREFLWSS